MLGDVTETLTYLETCPETLEDTIKVNTLILTITSRLLVEHLKCCTFEGTPLY